MMVSKVHEEHIPGEGMLPCIEIQKLCPRVSSHFHRSTFELVLVKGSYGKRLVGTQTEAYGNDDLLLVGPGVIHGWMAEGVLEKEKKPVNYVLQFNEDSFGSIVQRNDFYVMRKMLEEASQALLFSAEIISFAEEQFKIMVDSNPSEVISRSFLLLEKLSRVPRRYLSVGTQIPSLEEDKINKNLAIVMEYISIHSSEVIHLQDIAKRIHMSVPSFTRFFRKKAGTSFGNYLVSWRIERAHMLILNTEEKIASIAFRVGFQNLANFNRIFKRYYKKTPRDVRRAARNND
jgi:YesN/AraC family two-component response regulator